MLETMALVFEEFSRYVNMHERDSGTHEIRY